MVRNLLSTVEEITSVFIMTETIHINDQVFQLDDLPSEALDNLKIIQTTKEKLEDLRLTLNFFNKAREAYKTELVNELKNSEPVFTFGID